MPHSSGLFLVVPSPTLFARALRRMCCRLAPSRQLGSSPPRQLALEGEVEGHEVKERLERNILRAGLRVLKGDRHALERNVRDRVVDVDLEKLFQLQTEYNDLSQRIELLRQQRNINIHAQSTEVKEGYVTVEHLDRGKQLKRDIAELEHQKSHLEQTMFPLLALLPNTSHPLCPVGGYESFRVTHTYGNKPEFDFPVQSHVEIGESLGLIDFSSAAETSGRRFYYLTGAAALLELALVQYAVNKAVSKGYTPVITPDIVRTGVVEGCGFHPRGEATQVYSLGRHHGHLSLSGTAEVPLAGMFIGKTLSRNQLPVKLVAFGRCYRAESGGAGHAVRGLYRVHQFSKVELFAITAGDEGGEGGDEGGGGGCEGGEGGDEGGGGGCEVGGGGGELLEEMVALQEEICAELGFHYRVLEMPTAELGCPAHRKYDIEVWMPGRGEYGEVTSASDCTSFQSQRLGITTQQSGRRSFPHTLNATACAMPRTIIAILENHQKKDGSVAMPSVLHPYLPPHCHRIM